MILYNQNMPKSLEDFGSLPLQYEDLENLKNNYQVFCFSVFNHWLTENEFIKTITSYEQILEKTDKKAQLKYFNNERKLINFYLQLYNITECYGVFLNQCGSCIYVKYNSEEEFKHHVTLGVREQLGMTIIMPNIYSVISSGNDLTHQLYILNSYPQNFEIIYENITKCKLYILE